jgi:hypothetical protein
MPVSSIDICTCHPPFKNSDKRKKAERAKFEYTINQVRARRQETRKASEKSRLLTFVAQAPTKLQLIVDGLVVSQTTQY